MRSGIVRGDGQAFALPAFFIPVHDHYCPEHDHRWRCVTDPCVLHEATCCEVCGDVTHKPSSVPSGDDDEERRG